MKLLFSGSSPLVIAIKKLFDMVALDLLWLITSIPLITLGMTTAAFYDVVYKDIWHDRGMAITDYFRACRKNFRQGFPAGVCLVLLAAVIGVDIILLRGLVAAGRMIGYVWILLFLFLIQLAVYFIYLTAGIARFSAPIHLLLKNSLALFLTHVPVSILIAAMLFACGLGIWLIPSGLFILPALCMLGCCLLVDRVFRLYMTDEERQLEDEKNTSWRLQRKRRRG